jgi:hypothetical protein
MAFPVRMALRQLDNLAETNGIKGPSLSPRHHSEYLPRVGLAFHQIETPATPTIAVVGLININDDLYLCHEFQNLIARLPSRMSRRHKTEI